MTESDAPLLLRVAAGDSDAVTRCMQRYTPLIWSLARRSCPNRTEAEDAVQEIFIEVWRHAERFDASRASETTFIATIARRRLIDRHRRRSRRQDMVDLEAAAPPAAPAGGDQVELEEQAALAMDALRTLPEAQQQALKCAVYEGASHAEIAEKLGTPLGTVKTNIRRGLMRLREQLLNTQAGAGSEVNP